MEPKEKFEVFDEDIPVPCRKIKHNRVTLKLAEKLDIIHKVVIQHKMVQEVGKEYRIT